MEKMNTDTTCVDWQVDLNRMGENIIVGYVPYSKDLQHPGDRRRLAAWALNKGVELNLTNPLDSDILVLSNAANFNYWIKRAKQPVILDLVDGYLGEQPNFAKDLARNIVRSLRRTSDLRWITYTHHVREACKKADTVIVASIEQKETVLSFNNKVHVILDDLSELDSSAQSKLNESLSSHQSTLSGYIFWEGFGYTLKHFRMVAKDLDRFLSHGGWGMYLVTNEQFPRWGGYIGTFRTKNLIEKWFPLSSKSIHIIPWSIENVLRYSNHSSLAIIPINSNDKFAAMKPENKLLSMWHLGLPTLFSKIPSYDRVAREADLEFACIASDFWYQRLLEVHDSESTLEEMRTKGKEYIDRYHTHDILIEKWNTALTQSIEIFNDNI